MRRLLIGVDEAGRGPLAGPVSIGVVLVPVRFNLTKRFPGLKDSKQLSLQRREELYELMLQYAQAGELDFRVRYAGPHTIDTIGINRAVYLAIYRGVRAVALEPRHVHVLLDGLLYAPKAYSQETIIGGDESEPLIALASIVAKVRRDRLMRRLARQYPEYGFDEHKGYGTKSHYAAIQKYGLSDIHRRTYYHLTKRKIEVYA